MSTGFTRVLLLTVAACLLSTSIAAHPGSGIAVDQWGLVYFLDTGSGLWRIDTAGVVTRLSPLRNHWLAIDLNSRFGMARLPSDPAGDWVITNIGRNPTVLISTDFPIVIGRDGGLYYPQRSPGPWQIVRATAEGGTSILATLPTNVAYLNGMATVADGSIYYTQNSKIFKVDKQGQISTAATVQALANGPSIPDTEKPYLRGLSVDAKGTMYVADSGDARVLKISPAGAATTLIQVESPWAPTAVALSGDIVYVLEYLHTDGEDRLAWLPRVRKITPDGHSTIIATIEQMPGARPVLPAKVAGIFDFQIAIFDFFQILS